MSLGEIANSLRIDPRASGGAREHLLNKLFNGSHDRGRPVESLKNFAAKIQDMLLDSGPPVSKGVPTVTGYFGDSRDVALRERRPATIE